MSDTITLYQYKRAMGVPNGSPFCMKLETWLRIAGIEHEVKVMADPRKAPLAKLPMIEHNGQAIADSSCIIEHLTQACNITLDADLTDQQLATAHAYQRMIEEHTYWGIVYGRWVDRDVWPEVREVWFGKMPPVVKQVFSTIANRMACRDAHGQGLSRHSKDEIKHRISLDIAAISTELGDKSHFLGEQPRSIDATVYAFVANLLEPDIDWDFDETVKPHANLVAYCQRMGKRYFSDLGR